MMKSAPLVAALFAAALATAAAAPSPDEPRHRPHRGGRRPAPTASPRAPARPAASQPQTRAGRGGRGELTAAQLLQPRPRLATLPPETHVLGGGGSGPRPPIPPGDAPGRPDRPVNEPHEPTHATSDSSLSPKLVGDTFNAEKEIGALDPQIAVSKKHVLVSAGSVIAMYDRSGNLLTAKSGGTLQNPLTTATLYQPLLDPDNPESVNSFLNLPEGLKCNAKKDPATHPSATKFCLNEFYDTRLMFDTKRERFWIASLARNAAAKYDDAGNSITDPMILMGRRSYLFVAVSKTEDPRDGFYLYWWNGAIDMGACNTPIAFPCPNSTQFIPGDAGDYPEIAVGDEYFVETHNVNNMLGGRGYGLVLVALADQLANGKCNDCAWNYWDLTDLEGDVINRIAPVQRLGTPTPDTTFIAHFEGKDLLLWGLAPGGTHDKPPALLRASGKTKRAFTGANDPPKLPGGVAGGTFFSGITAGMPFNAVHHNDRVYLTSHDCATFPDSPKSPSCTSSVRFIRVSVANFPLAVSLGLPTDSASGFLDKTFGLRGPGDDDDAVVYYGTPGISVTRNGDIVLVYQRAGASTYPEARYNVWYREEADLRGSRTLHEGNLSTSLSVHYAGIALDPDLETVWMAHAYGSQAAGGGRIAVGRVKP